MKTLPCKSKTCRSGGAFESTTAGAAGATVTTTTTVTTPTLAPPPLLTAELIAQAQELGEIAARPVDR
jgi:hypothetical protein